jgi:hypothetical protein
VKNVLLVLLSGLFVLSCTATQEKTRQAFVAAPETELRSHPDKDASVLAILPKDSDVEITLSGNQQEEKGLSSWYRTTYKGKIGWVRGARLFVIKEETPEATIAKFKNKIVPLALEGVFVSDYAAGVRPELKLHSDGTFDMTINFCEGMMPVTGKYVSTDRIIFLHGFASKFTQDDRICRTILSGLLVELERTSPSKLTILNDLTYDAVTLRYGFCSPNKGEHFLSAQ